MKLTSARIHFSKGQDKVIYASQDLIRRFNLGKKVRIKFGKKGVNTAIRKINKKGRHLYVSGPVRQSIHLPHSRNVFLMSNSSAEVQVGPLIGIMTTGAFRTQTQPFGNRSNFIKSYLGIGNKKAFYFAFSPRDINWTKETVLAHFIGEGGNWVKKTVPLPDVIYNRLPSRRTEKSSYMAVLRERFAKRNIPIFNWSFFDKWDVYHLLRGDADASRHVPESYIDPSPEQLKDMLEKHRFIYLKPTSGSLGKGIYRITYHHKRGYFVRFRRGGKNVLLRYAKFTSLMKLMRHSKGRLRNYVAQQGIRLVELDQCPIDFRFHLNKNGNNKWVVAGIGAKKAGRGNITTHVRTGGKLMTPEQALNGVFNETKAQEMLRKMKHVSIRLAEAIEQNYPHLIGELGFDLGLDQSGNIWMFEANSKPGRSIFKHPALKNQGRASLTFIYEYCLYLSKFRVGRRNA